MSVHLLATHEGFALDGHEPMGDVYAINERYYFVMVMDDALFDGTAKPVEILISKAEEIIENPDWQLSHMKRQSIPEEQKSDIVAALTAAIKRGYRTVPPEQLKIR